MYNIDYVYDHKYECWSAYCNNNLLCSISRENVLRYKRDVRDGLMSEMKCFREMFGEILLSAFENEENTFLISAVLTKLFNSGI